MAKKNKQKMAQSRAKKKAREARKRKQKRQQATVSVPKGVWAELGTSRAEIRTAPVYAAYAARAGRDERSPRQVLVARQLADSSVIAGFFRIDTGCLGVKGAFILRNSIAELEKTVSGLELEDVPASMAAKLIGDAVAYAEGLGFRPGGEFEAASAVLSGIDASACDEAFEFGRDGKPFFVPEPGDSEAKVKRTVVHLKQRCGCDGFTFVAGERTPDEPAVDEGDSPDDPDVGNPYARYGTTSRAVDDAQRLLESHTGEIRRLERHWRKLSKRVSDLYNEEPFVDLWFDSDDVTAAMESAAPIEDDGGEALIKALVSETDRADLAVCMRAELPRLTRAGRYADGWVVENDAARLDEWPEGEVPFICRMMCERELRELAEEAEEEELYGLNSKRIILLLLERDALAHLIPTSGDLSPWGDKYAELTTGDGQGDDAAAFAAFIDRVVAEVFTDERILLLSKEIEDFKQALPEDDKLGIVGAELVLQALDGKLPMRESYPLAVLCLAGFGRMASAPESESVA